MSSQQVARMAQNTQLTRASGAGPSAAEHEMLIWTTHS